MNFVNLFKQTKFGKNFSDFCDVTADCGEYNIAAYVAAIYGHIENIRDNRLLPHIYCNI